ncbi:MAG: transcription-repair coupling factor, partial [Gammaproteobacteria bacterium]|nr:transcription-repair coupling factor [Gammaproteobacteria bacterium]
EIRGAGEVLGESQSGDMQEIGFNLYADMLNRAVKALKAGNEPDIAEPLGITTEINLHSPALLPNDYCGDVNERLTLYKRLANCATLDELAHLHEELIDRFGLLPSQASALLDTHRLRILAKPLGIAKIDASSSGILLQFIPNPPIDPVKIIQMIQTKPGCKLAGPDRLKVSREMPEVKNRVEEVVRLLKELG